MKKLLAFLIAIALLIPFLPTSTKAQDQVLSYRGGAGGEDRIKSIGFSDIPEDKWSTPQILRMSSLNILNIWGDPQFKPEQNITRVEVISSLIRLMGMEDQAKYILQSLANTDLPEEVQLYTPTELLELANLELAKAIGIISPYDLQKIQLLPADQLAQVKQRAEELSRFYRGSYQQKIVTNIAKEAELKFVNQLAWDVPAQRQEILLWTSRVLNLQPVETSGIRVWPSFDDKNSFDPSYVPQIEAGLQKRIMVGISPSQFDPRGYLAREYFAVVLDNAHRAMLPRMGITVKQGRIGDITQNTKTQDGVRVTTKTLFINTDWSTTEKIDLVSYPLNNGLYKEEIPVLDKGKLGNSTLLRRGQDIIYYIKDGQEVVLVEISPYTKVTGSFQGYDSQSSSIMLRNDQGTVVQYPTLPAFDVRMNLNHVALEDIPLGQQSTLYLFGGRVAMLDVTALILEGRVINLDPEAKTILIEDYDGVRHIKNYKDNTPVYTNGLGATLKDVQYDSDIILYCNNDDIMRMELYYPISNPGYIYPGSRIVTGIVTATTNNSITIKNGDSSNTYPIAKDTVIRQQSRVGNISTIKLGDRVRLRFDSTTTQTPSSVELNAKEGHIANIYKGTISSTYGRAKEVLLNNLSIYNHSDWEVYRDRHRLDISDKAEIYLNGSKISPQALSNYIGKDIYIVVENNFGKEQVVKALLSNGYEKTYYDTIQNIRWTSSTLNLKQEKNIFFDQGTIVMKEGRLLDPSFLTQEEAFVITDREGQNLKAAIISLENTNGFNNHRIYRGWLVGVNQEGYRLDGYGQLINNSWDYHKNYLNSKYLGYHNNTKILDNMIKNDYITTQAFALSQFHPFTYTFHEYIDNGNKAHGNLSYGRHYHDYYVYYSGNTYNNRYRISSTHQHHILYSITDHNDQTIAINIWDKNDRLGNKDAQFTERLVTGKVEDINTTYNLITLSNPKDWSDFFQRWQPVKTQVSIDARRAVYVKDNKPASFEDIQRGDNLYIIGEGSKGIIIIIN